MCGRAACALAPDSLLAAVAKHLKTTASNIVFAQQDKYKPSYNIAPSQNLPVLTCNKTKQQKKVEPEKHFHKATSLDDYWLGESQDSASSQITASQQMDQVEMQITPMHFGLLSSAMKSDQEAREWANKMINARCETVLEKRAYKRLIASQANRCIILVEGFYEWCNKEPYYCKPKSQQLFAIAGLCDVRQIESDTVQSVTMLTTSSKFSELQILHDRRPLILHNDALIQTWLHEGNLEVIRKQVLQADLPTGYVDYFRVSSHVNSVAHDDIKCCTKWDAAAPSTTTTSKQQQRPLQYWFLQNKKRPLEKNNDATLIIDDNDEEPPKKKAKVE